MGGGEFLDRESAVVAAARLTDMNGWMEMDTAPRDGTPILALYDLNCGSYDLVVVWWTSDQDYPWHSFGNSFVEHRIAYWRPAPPMPLSSEEAL